MCRRTAVAVRADVDVEQPDLALVEPRIAVAQVYATFADGLHLRAEQRDTGLPRVEDVVVVQRLPVLGDRRGLVVYSLLRSVHQGASIILCS
jgi:hypothetical protein